MNEPNLYDVNTIQINILIVIVCAGMLCLIPLEMRPLLQKVQRIRERINLEITSRKPLRITFVCILIGIGLTPLFNLNGDIHYDSLAIYLSIFIFIFYLAILVEKRTSAQFSLKTLMRSALDIKMENEVSVPDEFNIGQNEKTTENSNYILLYRKYLLLLAGLICLGVILFTPKIKKNNLADKTTKSWKTKISVD